MTFVCDMIYFVTVLLFGIGVSFCFAGKFPPSSKKNWLFLLLFCAFEGVLQVLISWKVDMNLAKQLYPLITHLPLVLFLVLVYKCTFLNSCVSVFSAYLCCQIPWWTSYFLNLFFPGEITYTVIYVLSAVLTFWCVYKYIAEPVGQFMEHSKKNALLIGSIPLCYYCFDYTATVYTDWLYSGNKTAVQFMPSVMAFFYFLFVIVYYKELSLKEDAKHQVETLELQIRHAAATLDNMRSLQENTITYRHDMRHHLGYIQALVSAGSMEKIQDYIQSVQSDIEAITPKNFCQNEVVNLILSTYDLKAENQGITLEVYADVPKDIPVSDTDLCAILSNALENAFHAVAKTESRIIAVRLSRRDNQLRIQISNPFHGKIEFKDGIPVSTEENHGLGTKSIAAIVDSYNGLYAFVVEKELFILRILLPLPAKQGKETADGNEIHI